MIILVLNGPNLNLLGTREVNVYGIASFEQLSEALERHAASLEVQLIQHQSNHEGQLIDWIQKYASKVQGIVINPGGLTHTSVSLRDALVDCHAKKKTQVVRVLFSVLQNKQGKQIVSM